MTKKLTFNFKGYSTICFVSFYNDQFKDDLNKIEKDNFDHLDFLQEHELKSFWLGKGMNNESEPKPTVEILENDKPIQLKSNDVFIYDGDYSNEDDQKSFEEINGHKYNEVLTGEHNGPGSEYIYFEKFDEAFKESYDIYNKISDLNW